MKVLQDTTEMDWLELWKALQNFESQESFILKLSVQWNILLWLLITTSLLIGWISKALSFGHIFKSKIKEQPINQYLDLCRTVCTSMPQFFYTLEFDSFNSYKFINRPIC